MNKTALLLIDVQNDFCPGGSLAVPQGDAILPALNRAIRQFQLQGLPIIASRDWHPKITRHFQTHGGPWPPHCVQYTQGAAFHTGLEFPCTATIISKGMDEQADGYSAFEARDENATLLEDLLSNLAINRLVVGGLATDYCVKATVLDARKRGIEVLVLVDGVAAVNLQPEDGDQSLKTMEKAGAILLSIGDLSL